MNSFVCIMRGPPGLGKTTAIEKLFDACPVDWDLVTVSADFYWHLRNGKWGTYEFDSKKLGEAHAFCRGMFYSEVVVPHAGLEKGIFVDNTNIKLKDFQWYIDIAEYFGYDVYQWIPNYLKDAHKLHERNVHNVPLETIQRMLDQIEESPLEPFRGITEDS